MANQTNQTIGNMTNQTIGNMTNKTMGDMAADGASILTSLPEMFGHLVDIAGHVSRGVKTADKYVMKPLIRIMQLQIDIGTFIYRLRWIKTWINQILDDPRNDSLCTIGELIDVINAVQIWVHRTFSLEAKGNIAGIWTDTDEVNWYRNELKIAIAHINQRVMITLAELQSAHSEQLALEQHRHLAQYHTGAPRAQNVDQHDRPPLVPTPSTSVVKFLQETANQRRLHCSSRIAVFKHTDDPSSDEYMRRDHSVEWDLCPECTEVNTHESYSDGIYGYSVNDSVERLYQVAKETHMMELLLQSNKEDSKRMLKFMDGADQSDMDALRRLKKDNWDNGDSDMRKSKLANKIFFDELRRESIWVRGLVDKALGGGYAPVGFANLFEGARRFYKIASGEVNRDEQNYYFAHNNGPDSAKAECTFHIREGLEMLRDVLSESTGCTYAIGPDDEVTFISGVDSDYREEVTKFIDTVDDKIEELHCDIPNAYWAGVQKHVETLIEDLQANDNDKIKGIWKRKWIGQLGEFLTSIRDLREPATKKRVPSYKRRAKLPPPGRARRALTTRRTGGHRTKEVAMPYEEEV